MSASLTATTDMASLHRWGLGLLQDGYKIIAPIAVGNAVEYADWQGQPLALDSKLPRLSPKSAWFPRSEIVMEMHRHGQNWQINEPVRNYPEVVIFGAHPCDVAAYYIQERLFSSDYRDAFFTERGHHLTFITLGCRQPSDDLCFCTSVGIAPSGRNLGDILLTPLENGNFALTIHTKRGSQLRELIKDIPTTNLDVENLWQKSDSATPVKFSFQSLYRNLQLPTDMSFWQDQAQGCISCGTCAFVCPTCHCFDLQDEQLGGNGVRQKNWDACTLPLFSRHASGYDPRPTVASRWHHRINHKFRVYPQKFHSPLCTGCGRCIRLCPGGLDMLETLQQLASPSGTGNSSPITDCTTNATVTQQTPNTPTTAPISPSPELGNVENAESNIYRSHLLRVIDVVEENREVRTLRLQFENSQEGREFTFQVGQFGLFSALGEGESAFCLSSSPLRKEYLECTFRQVGRVTSALRLLEPGDQLGFRGPYGHGFPVEKWQGKNIVLIGGGIGAAPMRSVLQYCLDKRHLYGALTVILGAKSWEEHCYKGEMDSWKSAPNLDLYLCIDKLDMSTEQHQQEVQSDWQPLLPGTQPGSHSIGFVPDLLNALTLPASNSVAVLCGPPIMMEKCLPILQRQGFTLDSIYLTLENRLKCGIGKCGHCASGGTYICQEGPVFTAEEYRG